MNTRRSVRVMLVAFAGATALSALHADPAPGLSVRVTPIAAIAVSPSADAGNMERSTSADLDYTLFQFPLISMSAGGMYSRASLEGRDPEVVNKIAAHGELSLHLASFGRLDSALYARAGAYRLFSGDSLYDGRSGAAVSGGLRLSQTWAEYPAFRFILDAGYTRNYEFRNYAYVGGAVQIRVLRPRPLDLVDLEFADVFPVLGSRYVDHPIGRVIVQNRGPVPIEEVRVAVEIDGYTSGPWTSATVPVIDAYSETPVTLHMLFSPQVLSLVSDVTVPVRVVLSYRVRDVDESEEMTGEVVIRNANAISWSDDRRAAAFVTSHDPEVMRYSRNVVAWTEDPSVAALESPVLKAMALHVALGQQGIAYVVDPESSYADLSGEAEAVDFVQFPRQTFRYLAGDCDDLSVLYCSLLEAVGVQTAFVTVPGHIFIAVAIDGDSGYFRDDRIIHHAGRRWLPIETTIPGRPFDEAWSSAASQWLTHRQSARVYPLSEARRIYPAPDLPEADLVVDVPDAQAIRSSFEHERARFSRLLIQGEVDDLQARIETRGSTRDVNRLGVLYARHGLFNDAREQFELAAAGDLPEAWENLGLLAIHDGDYEEALHAFEMARHGRPESHELRVQIARVQMELGDYESAALAYTELLTEAPEVAAEHAYLAEGERAGRTFFAAVPAWKE